MGIRFETWRSHGRMNIGVNVGVPECEHIGGVHRAQILCALGNGSKLIPQVPPKSRSIEVQRGQVPARVYFRRELVLQG